MPWIPYVLGLTAGGVLGWVAATCHHGRRLRGFCHFEAANLVDPPKET
ncbi:hypothetical protein [Streptomyces sp. NPDC060188]